jgi:pseudouridine synthase
MMAFYKNVISLLFAVQITQSFTSTAPQSSYDRQINQNGVQVKTDGLIKLYSKSNSNKNKIDHPDGIQRQDGIIRLNKVFKATHSRREADKLIASGRVTLNGAPITYCGMKVIPYQDEIRLDGTIVRDWEEMNFVNIDDAHTFNMDLNNSNSSNNNNNNCNKNLNTGSFEYIKYFKPIGVTCTSDLRIQNNIIHAIKQAGYNPKHRVYPVGRLDKQTSGLIVLTSDGRMVNSVLRGENKYPKVYKVMVDGLLDEHHLQQLRNGVVIKTIAQRKNRSVAQNTLIASTKPCKVKRLGPSACELTLVEGRNRQIRKMMQAIGFTVVKLHRVEFMSIRLLDNGDDNNNRLRHPGDWAYLNDDEMRLVENAIRLAKE